MFLCTQVECIWTFCCCSICSVTLPPQQFWLTNHCHHCFVALLTRFSRPKSSEEKMKMEAWRGRVGVIWTSLWKTLGHLVPCEPCWDATDMEDGPNFTTRNSKTPTPTTILQVQVVLKPPQMWVACGVWTPVQEQRKVIFSEICCVANLFKRPCFSGLRLKLTIEAACRQRLSYERTRWGGALLISTLITHRGVGTYSDWTYREGSYHFSKPGFCLVKDSFLVTVYPYKCFVNL